MFQRRGLGGNGSIGRSVDRSIVSLLMECGHKDVVQRLALEGDGNCALAVADELIAEGGDEALEVLAPIATVSWRGVEKMSSLLADRGRGDDAIALVRSRADAGERDALQYLARLLHRLGRADEAFDLLRDHVDDWWHAEALVDVTDGQDRDEEVAVLTPIVSRSQPAAMQLARLKIRQGRVEEALELVRKRPLAVSDDPWAVACGDSLPEEASRDGIR